MRTNVPGYFGLLLILLTACSGPVAATPTAASFVCPVTPFTSGRPPDPQTAAFTNTWLGNESLWAGLDRAYAGQWYAGPNGVKVLWYRNEVGDLKVEGRRLDGSAPPLRANIPAGYGSSGYQASGLIFATAGCWQVIGRAGSSELKFVVSVRPADQNPVR